MKHISKSVIRVLFGFPSQADNKFPVIKCLLKGTLTKAKEIREISLYVNELVLIDKFFFL